MWLYVATGVSFMLGYFIILVVGVYFGYRVGLREGDTFMQRAKNYFTF
jgi:hypothetical protein